MPTPEEINQVASMGTAGWVGWLVAMSFGGVVAFRRIWHTDKTMSANASGTVDAIQRLYDLLDAERKDKAALHILLAEANERTDEANRERNAAIREIGDIKAQLASLQAEVRMLREDRGHDKSN